MSWNHVFGLPGRVVLRVALCLGGLLGLPQGVKAQEFVGAWCVMPRVNEWGETDEEFLRMAQFASWSNIVDEKPGIVFECFETGFIMNVPAMDADKRTDDTVLIHVEWRTTTNGPWQDDSLLVKPVLDDKKERQLFYIGLDSTEQIVRIFRAASGEVRLYYARGDYIDRMKFDARGFTAAWKRVSLGERNGRQE